MLDAVITLTDEQIEQLRDLFTEVSAGARLTETSGKEHRYAIMGQVFGPDDEAAKEKAGCAKFYLLTTQQYKIVNAAIIEAWKL